MGIIQAMAGIVWGGSKRVDTLREVLMGMGMGRLAIWQKRAMLRHIRIVMSSWSEEDDRRIRTRRRIRRRSTIRMHDVL